MVAITQPEWAAHEPLDNRVLERLRSVGLEIGADVLGDVMVAYRDASLPALESVRGSVRAADADELRRSAHGLKGSSLQVGANRVAGLAKLLEEIGRAGDLAAAPELIAHLERELRAVLDEFARLRAAP